MWKLYVCLLAYLALETRNDIRNREISVRNGAIAIVAACALRIGMRGLNWNSEAIIFLFWAVIPAGLLFLAGKVTRQAIGYGDAILILVCGFYLGGRTAGALFVSGLFCMFPAALMMLIFGKASRKAELPFAPFLLGAYLIWMLQAG